MKGFVTYLGTTAFVLFGVGFLGSGCGKDAPEKIFMRAAKAQKAGEYAAAIKSLETYLGEYPDHGLVPVAHMRIGMARKALGDVPGALKAYEDMYSSARDFRHKVLAQRKIQDTYRDSKDWVDALRVGADLIASTTGAEKVNQMLRFAEIMWRSGEKEETEEYLRKSAAESDIPAARAGFLITLANFLRADGRLDESTLVYDEVARGGSFPVDQRIKAYNRMGTVLYFADRSAEAVETFEEIKDSFPDDFETCLRADTLIAQIYYKKENDRLDASLDRIAVACSDRIESATEPDEANRVRLLMGDAFQKVERYAKAQDAFEMVKRESKEGSGHWRIAEKRIDEIESAMIGRAFQGSIR